MKILALNIDIDYIQSITTELITQNERRKKKTISCCDKYFQISFSGKEK